MRINYCFYIIIIIIPTPLIKFMLKTRKKIIVDGVKIIDFKI